MKKLFASLLFSSVLIPSFAFGQMGPNPLPYFEEANEYQDRINTLESQTTQIKDSLFDDSVEIQDHLRYFTEKKGKATEKYEIIDGYKKEYDKAKSDLGSAVLQSSEQERILKDALVEMENFKAIHDEAQTRYLLSGAIRTGATGKSDQADSIFLEGETIINRMKNWENPDATATNIRDNIRDQFNEITKDADGAKIKIAEYKEIIEKNFGIGVKDKNNENKGSIQSLWLSDGGTGTENGIQVMYQESDKTLATMQCELYAINIENPQTQNRYREDVLFPSWRRGNQDPEALCQNLAEGVGITGIAGKTNDGNFIFNLIPNVTTLIFRVATPIILLSLIIIGIRFIYAGQFGSYEEDIQKSKEYLRNVVVGVLIMVLSYSIIRAVYNLFVQ